MLTLSNSYKNGVTSSPIRRIMEMASRDNLIKMGLNPDDVISFAGGWVNHPAPEELRQEYIDIAQDANLFHKTGGYSDSDGSPELKKALLSFNAELYGIHSSTEENIIIGQSSTQLTFSLFKILLNPGDKVLLFDPAYANYPEQIQTCMNAQDIVCFPLFDEKTWTFVADENKLTDEFEVFMERERPKMILFSSPDNPSGMILPDKFVKRMLDVALKLDCFVAIDFAYYTFLYDKELPQYFFFSHQEYPNLIKIFSNSKWCRGLGRRLGWIEATSNLIVTLKVVQQSLILCPDSLHQMALTNYINKGLKDGSIREYIRKINDDYQRASDFLCKCIAQYLSSRFTIPEGGLYSVVDVGMDGDAFVAEMLKKTGVVFVPGGGFGNSLKNGIRISFGPLVYDKAKIEEGFIRVSKVFHRKS
jgi:aspartate/methionine/tyrosine aminotransferase